MHCLPVDGVDVFVVVVVVAVVVAVVVVVVVVVAVVVAVVVVVVVANVHDRKVYLMHLGSISSMFYVQLLRT
jgi:hypothetical protein